MKPSTLRGPPRGPLRWAGPSAMKHSRPPRGPLRWEWTLLGVGALVACLCLGAALTRPLTQDEVDPFCVSAAAVARQGPAALGERAAGSPFPGETLHEIPHPPLLTLLLAAAFWITGPGALTARALGLALHVVSVALLALLARRCAPDPQDGRRLAAASAGLYVLLPLAVQYPLFTDIDNSLLTPLLLGSLLLALRHAERPSTAIAAGMAAFFALCLWGKETTPYIALAAIALWWMLARGPREALRLWITVGAAGTALFAATWVLFCGATGVPAGAFIEFTIGRKLLQGGVLPPLGPSLQNLWNEIQWQMSWLSPAFFLLWGWATIEIVLKSARGRGPALLRAPPAGDRFRITDPLGLVLIFCASLYAVHGLYYPGLKYIFPLVAPACLLAAALLQRRVGGLDMREAFLLPAGALLAGTLMLSFLRDPVLPGWSFRRELVWMTLVPAAALLAAFTAARPRHDPHPAGTSLLRKLSGLSRPALLAAAALLLACALQEDARQLRDMTTVPSYGDYGERGARAVIQALDGAMPQRGRMIARIDLAFAVSEEAGRPGRKRVVVGLFRNERQIGRDGLARVIGDPALAAVVLDKLPRSGWPEFTREEARALVLASGFGPARPIGDFELFLRAGASRPVSGPGTM